VRHQLRVFAGSLQLRLHAWAQAAHGLKGQTVVFLQCHLGFSWKKLKKPPQTASAIRGGKRSLAHLRGGLLLRPPPDGLGVLLGAFSSWKVMGFSWSRK